MSFFHQIPTVVILFCGALATMLVKEIPYWVKGMDRLPPFLVKCMQILPIAAMGALIFPGAFHDYGPQWYAGIGAIAIAFAIGYAKRPTIVGIAAAIVICYLLLLV
ncbi:MAG: AzlD domain-containing protein [Sphaerochaetaceae bacterium]|nr:AzlD domain-containing protein [Spirochaetales bacterium]MDY5499185.1 AzlD domain-containing protein [Sphaerochaetaceae bacterium]